MRATTVMLVVLLALPASARAADKPEELTPQRRQELEKKARVLRNEGVRMNAAGDYVKARDALKEALELYRALFPQEKYPEGHPDLAASLYSLGLLHYVTGEHGKAEPLCLEALAMYRALYPKANCPQGHAGLAGSITIVALLHQRAGEYAKAERLRAEEYAKAERLFQEALAMRRALYPKDKYPHGHPSLIASLNDLALLYEYTDEYSKAEPLYLEALAMSRTLNPRQPYPHRVITLNNLANLYQATGEYGKAEPLFQETLDIYRTLFPKEKYPQGHNDLALSFHNLAMLHQAAGEYGKAAPLFREALEMNRGLTLRSADFLAEAVAFNFLATQPRSRDGLLSASRHLKEAAVYDALWDSRAALTRIQERRHRDLMSSRDKETSDLAHQLRRARSDLAGRLLNPLRDPEQQKAAVQKLTDDKEDLEKRIAAKLQLAPQAAATSSTPKQLAQALPAETAFVDLYRYLDFGQDPAVKGNKGARYRLRYVAFILWRGQSAVRVELTEAAAIERAWTAWHKALVADRPDAKAEREEATRFADLAWQPIRKVLPADLKTVYLVPDGQLHQVPWGALPGQKPDTVLLDECAVCLVPHGPFVLEHLQAKSPARSGDTLLAYGGIDYAGEPPAVVPHDDVRGPLLSEKKHLKWGELPGTAKEQEQIVALARKVLKASPISRTGRQANTKQLEDDLPQARYAHLATHGFFADPEFRSALQFDPQQFERLSPDRRGGARSPLVLSGLVLAGANRQGKEAAEDRGIITAEGLIGLRLEGLELAVLSACETGLGEYGGGEGIYGLQRAFHVAGCQSVVASLWKVDDAATQALMMLFYRNLWEKKLDPAEALRQAQLTLYRHPEAVQVAAKRGLDFTESDLPKVEEKPVEKPKHALTAHWAAFTFSGVRPTEKGERK
jgi:CHAT domain-containing protein